ncbi:alpha amylase C-terminal domain-containing protein [Akkermansia muciniphila]|uniref:alpha amylase C-terminal domain-containing protein n=3 Tax=Akkermansia TaxID=239934 RepID=UPI001C7FB536|nr:alpha amylase C-terminal domain-containing protein [Akkermansia muciniphila]
MGNEFGHPEWIDFPREGNDWSYEYCRRQWSLVDNPSLRFKFLNAFDQAMVRLAQEARLLNNPPPFPLNIDETNHVMAFHRGGLVFVFNWSGDRAIMDYMLPVPQKGEWRVVLDTDNARFGGFGRQDVSMPHFTDGDGNLSLYLLPRTALVLKRVGSAVMARRLGRED